MTTAEKFKKQLALVFDSDLRTKQWENYVDYAIIGLIVISTIEVFLSTYDGIVEKYGELLHFVDHFTTICFTIEVSLRIWAADQIAPKYKGFWGRVRYCLSFYGLIDILSTFPFYLNFFFHFPYALLKALRIARLLRIFRYIKAFNILSRAISSKKDEMWVSLQFLTIITLILSFILFFVEHESQPSVYDNGWTSVVWAFTQYIGDPGNFADTPPITLVGRLIACVIGVLGIAIFAVPAGLIGSGFSEIMSEDTKSKKLKMDIERIVHAFKFEKDQHFTNLYVVPRYKDLNTIVTRQFLTTEDIVKAVETSDCLHLYNMANAANAEDNPIDKIVVFNYKRNTSYGCCIDRGSKVTIVFTSGNIEPCTSWFAYHIAKIGGFNFISKEVDTNPNNPTSYYNIPNNPICANLPAFLEDLNRLTKRPGSWAIPILGASGPRSRPHQFHFCYNSKKKDASYNDPQSKIKDYETFHRLYNRLSDTIKQNFDYNCDKNEYYTVGKQNIAHYNTTAENIFTLRVECYVWLSDSRRVAIIKALSDGINAIIEPEIEKQLPTEMVSRVEGHDFGMQDYVD